MSPCSFSYCIFGGRWLVSSTLRIFSYFVRQVLKMGFGISVDFVICAGVPLCVRSCINEKSSKFNNVSSFLGPAVVIRSLLHGMRS
jgi:hypothetical protein